jgi:hypothetical protein
MTAPKDVDAAVRDLVDLIRSTEDPKEAYWSIQQYGGHQDESCIEANRAGVRLFAAELLEAGLLPVDRNARAVHTIGSIEQSGEICLDHVALVDKRIPIDELQKSDKVTGGLIAMGCIAVGLFLVVCVVVGFITIVF